MTMSQRENGATNQTENSKIFFTRCRSRHTLRKRIEVAIRPIMPSVCRMCRVYELQ